MLDTTVEFLNRHPLILSAIVSAVVSASINSIPVIVHIVLDERQKRNHHELMNEFLLCFKALVEIDRAYIPWAYEQLSEKDRAMINSVIYPTQQLSKEYYENFPG